MLMKELKFNLLIATTLFTLSAEAVPVTIGGVELEADTVYHALIGPGSTRTSLHLEGDQPLDVHYISIDLSNPCITLQGASGKTQNHLQKVSEMAAELKAPARLPFSGINADFFDVTTANKTYPDGKERPRLTELASIIDGRIMRTSSPAQTFIFDENGHASISLMRVAEGFLSYEGKEVELGGVNIENINSRGETAPDDAVTIYTNDGWRSTYQSQFAGECMEIPARFIETPALMAGKECRLEILSGMSTDGNMTVPENGVVLLGRGTGREFLERLNPGNVVTVTTFTTLPSGDSVVPSFAACGNPLCVSEGVALESDGTRPDAVQLHPRTGIGLSKDGKTVIMMTVDGRGSSYGVTTRQLGDLLVYAGAWTGLNFDGGGSTTCWTSGYGVVNNPSDATGERTVATGLFGVAVGDDVDNEEIRDIRFEDWHAIIPAGAMYTPVILGYNSAGVLVETDFRGFTLQDSEGLGIVIGDGDTFSPLFPGNGILKANFGTMTASVMISVKDSEFSLKREVVHIDGNTPYAIELVASCEGSEMPAWPGVLTWSSEDETVASVSADGIVMGKGDGETVIRGVGRDTELLLTVKVEIAGGEAISLYRNEEDWTTSASQIKINGKSDIPDGGVRIDYTMGASISSAKLVLSAGQILYSHPDELLFALNLSSVPNSLAVTLLPSNESIGKKVELGNPGAGECELRLKLSDVFDTSDYDIWPLKFISLTLSPGEKARESGFIEIHRANAVYSSFSSVERPEEEYCPSGKDQEIWFDLTGEMVNPDRVAPGIYIRCRGQNREKILVR